MKIGLGLMLAAKASLESHKLGADPSAAGHGDK
jgi:hypothetical protein